MPDGGASWDQRIAGLPAMTPNTLRSIAIPLAGRLARRMTPSLARCNRISCCPTKEIDA
jgi:hypothetical protein